MDAPVDKIREYLDEQEETREELLDISHRAIRKSSSVMASLHRGDRGEVSEGLGEIKEDIGKLNDILDSEPQFSNHGALIAAHREYAEIILTEAFIKGEELPDPEEMGVLYKAYAQALAESLGELRRHLLNLLREDEVEEAREIHDRMEEIFGLLEQFDYPDSILPGIKHRRDGARKTLEKTRADITRAVREKKLREALSEAERKSGD